MVTATVEYLPNRLTLIYSKNHYKEENYLKVKTEVFKYITPPYSNDWVYGNIGILVCNVPTDSCTYILSSSHMTHLLFLII